MASNLDFLNKNLFRKYPFKASASLMSTTGLELPMDLIASISISTTIDRSNLYVSQAVLKSGYISITVEHYDPITPSNTIAIGCFSGQITDDYQTLTLTAFVPYVSGFLITGDASNIISYVGLYSFAYDSTVLEPTTVFCYTPPAVTSLNNGGNKAQGNVTFGNLTNLTKTISAEPDSIFLFSVVDTTDIESLADFSSEFNNCPTPCIYAINGTVPYPPDATSANDNNIYLFGVSPITFEPVQITASPPTYTINLTTPGFALSNLCSNSPLLPPVAPNFVVNRAADSFTGLQRYYSKSQTPVKNFLQNIRPEYLLWPQPNVTLSYTTVVTTSVDGTFVIMDPDTILVQLLTSLQSATVQEINVSTATSSGTTAVCDFNFVNSSVTTNVIPNFNVTDEGIVTLAPSNSTFVPTTKFSVDLSSITTATTLTITVFYKLIPS